MTHNQETPGAEKGEEQDNIRILQEAKTSAFIINWFGKWCKQTNRSGGILITTSIKELLTDFYNSTQEGMKREDEPWKNFDVRLKAFIDKKMTEAGVFDLMITGSVQSGIYAEVKTKLFDSIHADEAIEYLKLTPSQPVPDKGVEELAHNYAVDCVGVYDPEFQEEYDDTKRHFLAGYSSNAGEVERLRAENKQLYDKLQEWVGLEYKATTEIERLK